MRSIPLAHGFRTIVDDVDYEMLNKYKWHAEQNRNMIYVRTILCQNGKQKSLRMHRLILKAIVGQIVDHINGNGLDNRRMNLRLVTAQQNRWNTNGAKYASSKYKGVSWHKSVQRWATYVKGSERLMYLGSYHNEFIAAWVYDRIAKSVFGKFARLNLPKREI